MKTIFGLFDQQEQAEAVTAFARNSSISDEHIKLLDGASPSENLVEPSPRSETKKGIRSFAILGTLIFAVFGAFAAVGSVTSTGAPIFFAVQIFVLFVLIGFLSGVGMGFVKGRSDGEQDIQNFRDVFERGAVMVVVETDRHVDGIVEEMRRQSGQQIHVSEQARPMHNEAAPELHTSPAH